jgi:hypothetical protein
MRRSCCGRALRWGLHRVCMSVWDTSERLQGTAFQAVDPSSRIDLVCSPTRPPEAQLRGQFAVCPHAASMRASRRSGSARLYGRTRGVSAHPEWLSHCAKVTAWVKLRAASSVKQEPVTHVTPTLMGSRSSVRHVELDQAPPVADQENRAGRAPRLARLERRPGSQPLCRFGVVRR